MKKLFSTILILLLLTIIVFPQKTKLGGRINIGGKVNTITSAVETDFVTDTFTDTTVLLSSHTGELGATWTFHSGYSANSISILDSSDATYPVADPAMAYASGTPPSADYCVEGVINVVSVTTANTAITWRVDTATNTMLIFQLNNGTGWRLRKIVSGTQTTIGTEDTTTNIPSVGQSRTIRACSVGNVHTAYVNGTLLSGVGGTDSSVTAAGKAGIRFVGAQTSTTGYHLESFRAFTQ